MALSIEGHDTHLDTTLAHNLKVGGWGVCDGREGYRELGRPKR